MLAYAVGLVPSALYATWSEWPPVAQLALLAVLGSLLLVTIGTAQWVELRRHLDRAGGTLKETPEQKRDRDEICAAYYRGG